MEIFILVYFRFKGEKCNQSLFNIMFSKTMQFQELMPLDPNLIWNVSNHIPIGENANSSVLSNFLA